MNSYAVFSFPAYGVCAFYLRKDGIRENPSCLLQQRLSLLGMIMCHKQLFDARILGGLRRGMRAQVMVFLCRFPCTEGGFTQERIRPGRNLV